MTNMKPVKIEGQLFWSKWMKEPNKKFNEANDKFECTIGMLSNDDVAKLTELGIKVKHKELMGHYIVGKSKYVFAPIDAKTEAAVDIEMIGNGTKATAIVTAYTHKMSKMHGNAPSIKKLWVDELVIYVPPEESLDDIAL